jgi:hypothetical protein
MTAVATKRQNFNITPEQEAEISWLRDALGASSVKDTVLRAVRIAAVLSRETQQGGQLVLRTATGEIVRIVIPELERPADDSWKYLVHRQHSWRRQMHMKGRRMLAADIWRDMVANGQTADEAALEWDIPVDAVAEAVRWCEANQPLLVMEADEEKRQLESRGIGVATPG